MLQPSYTQEKWVDPRADLDMVMLPRPEIESTAIQIVTGHFI
jgi:hypothetical protein